MPAPQDSIEERVERGAALLDTREPDWAQRVDPVGLRVDSSECVLFRLFNYEMHFRDCLARIGLRFEQAAAFGFGNICRSRDNSRASSEWKRRIRSRRQSQSESTNG